MILKDIRLEIEPRDSDFIRLNTRGHLESSYINVWLDRSSIVDCLMAKDITQDAEVVFEMVSTDRRSLRFKRTVKLSEFDFSDPIRLRLFNGEDVIQIKFEDQLAESFVSLKCSELPLDIQNPISWFVQVKSK